MLQIGPRTLPSPSCRPLSSDALFLFLPPPQVLQHNPESTMKYHQRRSGWNGLERLCDRKKEQRLGSIRIAPIRSSPPPPPPLRTHPHTRDHTHTHTHTGNRNRTISRSRPATIGASRPPRGSPSDPLPPRISKAKVRPCRSHPQRRLAPSPRGGIDSSASDRTRRGSARRGGS